MGRLENLLASCVGFFFGLIGAGWVSVEAAQVTERRVATFEGMLLPAVLQLLKLADFSYRVAFSIFLLDGVEPGGVLRCRGYVMGMFTSEQSPECLFVLGFRKVRCSCDRHNGQQCFL